MNTKQLESWIGPILAAHDFHKVKREWYYEGDECLIMVSLEKSPHGGQYYLDLGASPRQLLGGERPREYQCHFRVRLESIIPNPQELLTAMDLEDPSIKASHREQVVVTALREYGIPLLTRLRTLSGAARLVNSHPNAVWFLIRSELQELFRSNVSHT